MKIEKDLAGKFRHYIEVDGETFSFKFNEEKSEEEILLEIEKIKSQRIEQQKQWEDERKRNLEEQIRLLTVELNG